jgi:hypothetical protein
VTERYAPDPDPGLVDLLARKLLFWLFPALEPEPGPEIEAGP